MLWLRTTLDDLTQSDIGLLGCSCPMKIDLSHAHLYLVLHKTHMCVAGGTQGAGSIGHR